VLLTRLGNYFGGIVYIQVCGIIPEKFINLCLINNILLWAVTKKDQDFYAYIRLGDFFSIRPIVKNSQTRIKVLGYNGFPFFLKKVKHRKMFVGGALLFCFLLHYFSSFVWFVDVEGVKTLSKDQVLSVVYAQGLKPGSQKGAVERKAIENTLMVTLPEVAWVSVSYMGTRAMIEIVEKTIPKQESKEPANVVADKNGVITELIVLSGQAAVKKGATVKKGDILIKGEIPPFISPDGNTAALPGSFIKATGIVKAKVWYDSYGEDWLVREIPERTGNKVSTLSLKIGSREFALKTAGELPFATYETEILTKNIPWWRNSGLPVESTMHVFYETLPVLLEKSNEECLEEAQRQALAALADRIPENAQILSRNIEVIKMGETNVVRVRISVEAIEDIGRVVNISQGG
jgi:similar to stage IV sporulation protein